MSSELITESCDAESHAHILTCGPSPSGDGRGPAGSRVVVAVHVGSVHVADLQRTVRRSVRPHRHRRRRRALRTLRLLCHLQGAPLDVKAGLYTVTSSFIIIKKNVMETEKQIKDEGEDSRVRNQGERNTRIILRIIMTSS